MGKKNDNTLVKNASFLMIAALISKIIGMLYKSPLSNTLGNSSMGLFNYAQNVYFILLMIASFSIPQAVSKIMAEKLAFKRYRDAQKVFPLCSSLCCRQWAALWHCSVSLVPPFWCRSLCPVQDWL